MVGLEVGLDVRRDVGRDVGVDDEGSSSNVCENGICPGCEMPVYIFMTTSQIFLA